MAGGVLAGLVVLALTAAGLVSGTSSAQADDVVPFGSRPLSGPIDCIGGSDVVISGRTFRDLDDRRPAITVRGCRRVVIEDDDFVRVAEPIYVVGSREVVIRHNRYRDITGPHLRDGSHRGNFTQWDHSFGGAIVDNVGIGGDTEDVVSIYASGGLSRRRPLVIARNRFEGRGWRSPSGAGILVGDAGGGHVLVEDNVLVDVGQVGIGVAGGHDIRVVRNTVYGPRRARSNVGIYAWGQGAPCSDVRIAANRVDFRKADGTRSDVWDGGNCGPIHGWATNHRIVGMRAVGLGVRF